MVTPRRALALLSALVVIQPSAGVEHAPRAAPGSVADSSAEHPAPAPTLGVLKPELGTFHFVMLQRAKGDTTYRPFGSVVVTRKSETVRGVRALRSVADYDWGSGRRTIDTTISVIGTLAPLSERTHTPSRIVSYDFHRLRSTGMIGPPTALVPINDSLPTPAFKSGGPRYDRDVAVVGRSLSRRHSALRPRVSRISDGRSASHWHRNGRRRQRCAPSMDSVGERITAPATVLSSGRRDAPHVAERFRRSCGGVVSCSGDGRHQALTVFAVRLAVTTSVDQH